MTATPLVPTARFAPAAATGVAQQQLAASDAAVADLRREMSDIREMLQSVRPAMATPSTEVATDPPAQTAASLPGPSSSNLQRAGMVDPPWPTVADMVETAAVQPTDDLIEAICNLPGPTQTRISPMITNTLSIHHHVPAKIRSKVWSHEFVDIFSLLPEVTLAQQEMAFTVRLGGGG